MLTQITQNTLCSQVWVTSAMVMKRAAFLPSSTEMVKEPSVFVWRTTIQETQSGAQGAWSLNTVNFMDLSEVTENTANVLFNTQSKNRDNVAATDISHSFLFYGHFICIKICIFYITQTHIRGKPWTLFEVCGWRDKRHTYIYLILRYKPKSVSCLWGPSWVLTQLVSCLSEKKRRERGPWSQVKVQKMSRRQNICIL